MTQHRILSLDGLRAVAIVMVMICHAGVALGAQRGFTPIQPVLTFGGLGVMIFFVVSGYLITLLLLQEIGARGTISLGKFYLRRTLRLLPAYYTLVAVVSIAYLVGMVRTPDWKNLLIHALTYTTNYSTTFFWYLGHSWSLSVEEQFYVLWPALLLFLGKKRGMACIATALIVCPVMRWYYASVLKLANSAFRFEAVADSLAAGCLFGGYRARLHATTIYPLFLRRKTVLIAPAWLALVCTIPPSGVRLYLDHTISILAIVICLDSVITFPDTIIGKVLNTRAFVYVGSLSYSLYLWQQPFLDPYTHSRLSQFPVNLFGVAITSLISYYCIERPGLNLRERISMKLFTSQTNELVPDRAK